MLLPNEAKCPNARNCSSSSGLLRLDPKSDSAPIDLSVQAGINMFTVWYKDCLVSVADFLIQGSCAYILI